MRSIPELRSIGIIFATILGFFLYYLLPHNRMKAGAANGPVKPLWEVDLARYGFQGRPPFPVKPGDALGTWTYKQGVVFTRRDLIAAFFIVRDVPSGSTAEGHQQLRPDSYRLVAVFLDSDRGKFIKELDWPLASITEEPFFFPTKNGRFVVGIGNALSLYSSDFKILAQSKVHSGMSLIASPSGETLLLGDTRRVGSHWVEQFDLLETEGLTPLKSWQSAPQTNEILWGDEIASMNPRSISIKTAGTPERPLLTGSKWLCGDWAFVNKQLIVMFECGGTDKISIVSTDGKILRQFDLGLEQRDGPIVASQNGRRFAVPTRRWGSGRNNNPEKLIARVFGLDTDVPLLSLDVVPHYSSSPNFDTPEGDTRFGWGGLALSPDGDALALKSGPIIGLYQVPESGKVTGDRFGAGETAHQQPASSHPEPAPEAPIASAAPSPIVEQVLSWLPADTETVIAANGPFPLPNLKQQGQAQDVKHAQELDEVKRTFRIFPLGLFGFSDGILNRYSGNQQVLLALEASRHFRAPRGLGEGPFEGCDVVVFARGIAVSADSFLKQASKTALRMERIEGHEVLVFQEKSEEDVWTTFVGFIKPNIAITATNEDYLREILAKVAGKGGDTALPASLPEWRYVDSHAAFWALRHYDRNGASIDPTSPFGKKESRPISDERAIGLAFSFDPDKSATATITYLSASEDALPMIQELFAPLQSEPGGSEMHITYRQKSPGVVGSSFNLQYVESAETFAFLLWALLGHVVAL